MSRVVVIGGGFAGLSAAVSLSGQGIGVTLLEQRRHLGGRAYSFTDRDREDTVDNGQHLFMACYRTTRDFLEQIGTADHLHFQDRFRVDFSHPCRGPSTLAFSPRLPSPLHLLAGFLRFGPVGPPDVLRLRRIAASLASPPADDPSVDTWLDRCGQSARIRASFWDPLCISTLNADPAFAPARHLIAVLREAFFGGRESACLGYSRVGLSALYTDAARRYIETRGGRFQIGAAVTRLETVPDGPTRIHLKSGDRLFADACICTVPPPALARILPPRQFPDLIQTLSRFRPSPILSVNLWFDRPILRTEFLGLLGTQMQWVFNKAALYKGYDLASEGHIAVVASAADHLVNSTEEDLVRLALKELHATVPGSAAAHLQHHRVVRERQATFTLPPGQPPPPSHTVQPDLFLAGDWTDTELPGTVESAVRSGYRAAEEVARFLRKLPK